ncbi:hypothetical protein [Kineococcus sp. SYSU DK018]
MTSMVTDRLCESTPMITGVLVAVAVVDLVAEVVLAVLTFCSLLDDR